MSFFNYENNNFYYEIIGNGPALVLSHPYMSSTTHWHKSGWVDILSKDNTCLLYTSPSPRDATLSRMPSSA